MIADFIHRAELAGIDHLKHVFFQNHSRVIERTEVEIDGVRQVKLCEIRNAVPHLICIAPAKYATMLLAGMLEVKEEEAS